MVGLKWSSHPEWEMGQEKYEDYLFMDPTTLGLSCSQGMNSTEFLVACAHHWLTC